MQQVKAQLDQLALGSLVGYADFVQEPSQFAAVAAALSRLRKAGEITRFAKGQYYRPHLSRFGLVPPATKSCWPSWAPLRGSWCPMQPVYVSTTA